MNSSKPQQTGLEPARRPPADSPDLRGKDELDQAPELSEGPAKTLGEALGEKDALEDEKPTRTQSTKGQP